MDRIYLSVSNLFFMLIFNRVSTQTFAVAQPAPINPFGTLPAVPQISIGHGGMAPSVQYGIASMPVSTNQL